MSNMEVAKTILAQLGGGRLRAMTGARDFTAVENGLRFRVPMRTKNGANVVEVKLTPADLYDVEFWSVRGTSVKLKGKDAGVYADELEDLFSERTGLATRM